MPKRSPGDRRAARLARLVSSADFERALGTRRCAATPHFALHHLMAFDTVVATAPQSAAAADLSTARCATGAPPVDDCVQAGPDGDRRRLGAVVPKRHARRAVTRALLKRQIYAVAERHRSRLAEGIWVVRQRAPFDRALFPSAASDALKHCVRAELESLFEASRR